MIERILPPEEWAVGLKGTEAEHAWPLYDPERVSVVVVEHEGRTVATWTVMQTVTVECLWADPAYRGSFGVCKRLLNGMRRVAQSLGVKHVFTASQSEHVTDLIRRFGGIPVPADMFVLPVEMANGAKRANRAIGRRFHDQIEALIPDSHPDDSEHDEAVGKALRTAIEGNDPGRAEAEYGLWADRNGYVRAKFLGTIGGKMRADIGTAVIEIGNDYRVSLVKEAVCQ